MKNRKMYEALTEIDSEYLERAYPIRRRRMGKAVIAAMLCAAILLSLGTGIAMHLKNNTPGETTAPTVNTPEYDEGGKIVNVSAAVSGTLKDGKEADEGFISAVNDFSVKLMQAQMTEGENTLLSPLSAMYALSMTANGADGATLKQMEEVLGGELSIDELNEYLRGLYARLLMEENGIKSANSIWIRDRFSPAVSPTFLEKNAHYYGADVYTAPFNPDTVKEVNKWAYERTDGMIEEIIEDIEPDAVMLLLNSLLFESDWEKKIKESYNDKFTNADGDIQSVIMMEGDAEYYIEDINGEGCIKKLSNGCSLFAILPKADMTADEYAATLTGETLYNMLNGALKTKVGMHIPAFSSYTENDLSKALQDMGMKDAFSETDSDFSKICEPRIEELYIGTVAQNTKINVTMDGVKAGAATVVQIYDKGADFFLQIFDRPFVYGIMTEDGIPLFIGVQNQM